MKKLKLSLSVLVMLLVSGGVALAVVQSLNGLSTGDQTLLSNMSNISFVASSSANSHTLKWNGHLPIAKGGTGNGSFLTGSILFAAGSSISEDNSKLFWNDTAYRLGVGTNRPSSTIDAGSNSTIEVSIVSTNSIVASGSNQPLSLLSTTQATGNKVWVGGESLVVARLINEDSIASPSTGQIYFDKNLKKFRGYNGIGWSTLNTTPSATIGVLVVAGGGGGGDGNNSGGGGQGGGGGGGGGVVYNSSFAVAPQSYTVTIGSGGPREGNGLNSVFGTITAIGGGRGGNGTDTGGSSGGSGGGASNGATGASGTAGQGNNGGGGGTVAPAAGGGGGAGGVGGNDTGSGANGIGGVGGIGIADGDVGNLLSIASAPDTDHIAAGGGGGGGWNSGNAGGAGGNGGGGTGGTAGSNNPVAGAQNTGSGGGGAGWVNGGSLEAGAAGGSGIVIIIFPTGALDYTYSGTSTSNTNGGNTWVKMTTSGTFTVTSVN